MAQILPFRALRFTTAAGDLGRLLAPAHDLIESQERDQLALEPNNLVHATLPPAERDDRSKFVRYARASATLAGWRRERVLAVDGETAFYRVIGSAGIGTFGLFPLAPGGVGDDAPEDVRSREDRLRLLEATRTHFEPVIFEGTLDLHLVDGELLADTTFNGSPYRLERVRAAEAVEGQPVRILSGQDLYAASLAYQASQPPSGDLRSSDYVLALFVEHAVAIPAGFVLWSFAEGLG